MAESIFAERIVQNLLDTDFYKLTMMQAVLHNYPNAEVEWEFRCRNAEDLRPYLAEIRYQIERLAEVEVTADQLAFLERIPFMKPDFIRFLSLFRFNLRYVHTGIEDGQLAIRLRGPWLHVILFEVPLLAIVSEVRNRYRYREVVLEQVGEQLYRKLDWLSAQAS
ncbi:nicotinate phosphoribosyltransferase, partial [Pseudomonas aeruginosa]|nr:nicotinate phosphoribosyltransferase [Pseudomonas aeruginosa]